MKTGEARWRHVSRQSLRPILTDLGLDLYDCEFSGGVMRITVDRSAVRGRSRRRSLWSTRLISRELDHHRLRSWPHTRSRSPAQALNEHSARRSTSSGRSVSSSRFGCRCRRRRPAGCRAWSPPPTTRHRCHPDRRPERGTTVRFAIARSIEPKTVFVWVRRRSPAGAQPKAAAPIAAESEVDTTSQTQEVAAS